MSPNLEGFDPSETGPWDVLVSAIRRAHGFLTNPVTGTISGALMVATVGVMLYYDVPIPDMPNWMIVGIVALIFVSPGSLFVGKLVARWLYHDDSVPIHEVDPKTGDARLLRVAPNRLERMRVLTKNNKLRDRDFLHQITVNGQVGYEVSKYHEEPNVAIASWQAGESNVSMRRKKAQIDNIQTDLEQEADKALELLANFPTLLRGITKQVSEHMVRVVEGVEMPEGGGLHKQLTKELERSDPTQNLMEDHGAEGDAADATGDVDMSQVEEGLSKLQALADGGLGGEEDE